MKLTSSLLCSILFCSLSGAGAQTDKIVAIKRAEYAPKLAGTLVSPIWRDASVFTKFQTIAPTAGGKPTERMSVYLIYDNENLYAALRMYDKQPSTIRTDSTSPDQIEQGDWAALCFDTMSGEGAPIYFQISAGGVQANGTLSAGDKRVPGPLKQWSAVAKKYSGGWIAEVSIPFATLGIQKDEALMGFKAMRYLSRSSELSVGPGTLADPTQMKQIRFTAKKPEQRRQAAGI